MRVGIVLRSLDKLKKLGALYNKIKKENTSASYYRSSRKELIYDMVKKQPPDSIELTV
jgi:hypothetical protein